MGYGLLRVTEESVWGPDVIHHEVVQPQDFSWALKFQPLIHPCLTEEHVHGVLLICEHSLLVDKKKWALGR